MKTQIEDSDQEHDQGEEDDHDIHENVGFPGGVMKNGRWCVASGWIAPVILVGVIGGMIAYDISGLLSGRSSSLWCGTLVQEWAAET
jgi:hypothetical protein